MVPVVELRGAIPIATASGLDLWLAICVSVIGNMVPVPFIILFIRKIFEWMRSVSKKLDKVVLAMEQKAEKNRKVVDRYKFWGLFILVAIPLPGTGAWTGALVAAMLEMRLKDAVPAIFLGVVGAGLIVALVTGGVLAAFGI
ncbi:MAG: small multi-drug export protein [Clostridia bacterium]|nr:small multi-drug export protein [Clostridia bacterium]